jgi:ABC1 atypical kinase-like domain
MLQRSPPPQGSGRLRNGAGIPATGQPPQVPWPGVEQVLRAGLGAEVDDVFQSFDRTPLAAASIAQVHTATIRSGERVVVKVRRPGIDRALPPGSPDDQEDGKKDVRSGLATGRASDDSLLA